MEMYFYNNFMAYVFFAIFIGKPRTNFIDIRFVPVYSFSIKVTIKIFLLQVYVIYSSKSVF